MTAGLTRREFLRETISKTTTLSVGVGLGRWINFREEVQCKNCGSVNLYSGSYFFSHIFIKEPLYCRNCGINLRAQTYDRICRYCPRCSKETLHGNNRKSMPACFQIPFPNHTYLKNTKKPAFSVHDLRF
jgi:hypothetical protein